MSERYAIVVLDAPGVAPERGLYIKQFSPDARGGRGEVVFTNNGTQALTFATYAEAFEFWRQQSTVQPLRPDGQPNRPLTAWTVEIIPIR